MDQGAPERHDRFHLEGHIQPGDMAPWWNQGAHRFVFDPFPARYIVLGFRGAGAALGPADMLALSGIADRVAAEEICLFWVSSDPSDQTVRDSRQMSTIIRPVWDGDGTMTRAYGVGPAGLWVILDPMLRVMAAIPYTGSDAAARLCAIVSGLAPPFEPLGFELPPPVLVLPDVFEPALCEHLIACHERFGGRESGFMQEVAGRTMERYDPAWKRRTDHHIADPDLIDSIKARVARRVGPMLRRAFQFQLSRMERYLVACYAAEDGGHFGPHRDDTVTATQHRRFAVSINLNDDFEGGELNFPEFGVRNFKAPVGAALVFSCSLLHRVARITRGRRYAFLPFLHDEPAETLRVANLGAVVPPG